MEEERRGVLRVARAEEGRRAMLDVGSEAGLGYRAIDGDLHFKKIKTLISQSATYKNLEKSRFEIRKIKIDHFWSALATIC